MKTVSGVFKSRDEAVRAIERLRDVGVDNSRINLLTPDHPVDQLGEVPTTEGEQPGMGSALGAVVGGASGAALGAAVGSLLIPGVGPIAAIGFAAVALFGGAGGAVAGAAAGEKLEGALDNGLPTDELYVYEDALRQGRTVVIAMPEDNLAETVRQEMTSSGAESIDAARNQMWSAIRDAEAQQYKAIGGDFEKDEENYRRGFESALDGKLRGKRYEDSLGTLQQTDPDCYQDQCFRQGYERGATYYQKQHERSSSGNAGRTE